MEEDTGANGVNGEMEKGIHIVHNWPDKDPSEQARMETYLTKKMFEELREEKQVSTTTLTTPEEDQQLRLHPCTGEVSTYRKLFTRTLLYRPSYLAVPGNVYDLIIETGIYRDPIVITSIEHMLWKMGSKIATVYSGCGFPMGRDLVALREKGKFKELTRMECIKVILDASMIKNSLPETPLVTALLEERKSHHAKTPAWFNEYL